MERLISQFFFSDTYKWYCYEYWWILFWWFGYRICGLCASWQFWCIVTQLFYDNQKYFDFVDKCRKEGINVPIIPGLKPLGRKRHLSFIPKTFSVDFPDELAAQLDGVTTDEAIEKIGTEWCIKQSKELMEAGVPCLHFYTMGNSSQVAKIAKEVF